MSTAALPIEIRRRRLTLPAGWSAAEVIAGTVLALLLVAGLAAPLVVSLLGLKGPGVRDPSAVNLFGNPTGPSAAHPLGVDTEGRDVLSRIVYGLRSLILLSGAGGAIGMLVGQGLSWCATRHRWSLVAVELLRSTLASFPAVLFGLALGLTLGQSVWRVIVVIALTQLVAAPSRGALPRAAVRVFAQAAALDFALTFLGDGPGGAAPQLGSMSARAGASILAGVPAWWALLFPGLVLLVLLVAARVLGGEDQPRAPAPLIVTWETHRLRFVTDRLLVTAARIVVVIVLAALIFTASGGSNPGGASGFAGVGASLAATLSLLAGGAAVWVVISGGQVWLGTSRYGRLRLPGFARAGRALGAVLSLAPAGWLGLLAVYVFSESVGKLPLLPGAGSYVGLTAHLGRWAQSLVMPWLVLGLIPAAATAPELSRRIRLEAASGQQRVARAAGVPERLRVRQLRRAVAGPVLELMAPWTAPFLSIAVLVEAGFSVPGSGLLAVRSFADGRAASVSDVTVLAALLVILAWLVLDLARVLADPRAAR